jgi:tetratricopeptide (TPR) repeat protein
MRVFLLLLCLGLMLWPISGQTPMKPAAKAPSTAVKKASTPTKTTTAQAKRPAAKTLDDKKEFEKTTSIEDPAEKIAELKKFVAAFPDSALLNQARELLSSTASSLADARFEAGEVPVAIDLYKLAASSAPTPIPAALFNDSLSKIPNALYWKGIRPEAIEIAKTLETRIGSDPDQLSALAMFYVGIENGDEAERVAAAAVKADPTKSKAYGVLGLAERVNFKLDESAAAYSKALELDPNSASLRRNLAEIKRATGKADEAVALYRDAVTADPKDLLSQNGLVLSLFDAGKTEEAEKALAASLEQNPNNVMLIAGVAYWYAAHKNDEKAIEYARRAISVEPRYVWSHIALGRALMLQNRPVEAEEALLKARQYGNFPTLEYEIASARAMAGFYRDAVDGLEKAFTITDGDIATKIGGRVERKGASFNDILADERRASILEPAAADDADTASRLKQLLILRTAITSAKPDEAAVAKAADAFVAGDDNSKYHRQLYASSLLLNNKIAVDKAREYAEAAIGNSDAALTIPNAGAFVMASELYDSRQLALSRSEFLKVPEVPQQMLAAILRGRIEDLIGWALVQENKPADAEVHFKRALSILPDKSAWWRASMWRYGTALEADGKDADALDAYIKSYSIDKPDLGRYAAVERLYKKVTGSTEGLEAKIGKSPLPSAEVVAKNDTSAMPAALPAVTATPNIDLTQPTPATLPDPKPTPSPDITPDSKTAEVATAPLKSADPQNVSVNTVNSPSSSPTPDALPTSTKTDITGSREKPKPEPTPEATPSPTGTPTASPTPLIEISPASTPSPESSPSPTPDTMATPLIEQIAAKIEPSPSVSPTPVSEPAPTPTPIATPLPDATPTATPEAKPDRDALPTPAVEQTIAKTESTPTSIPAVMPEPTITPAPTPGPPVPQDPTPEPTPKPNGTPLVESTPVSIPDTSSTPAKHVRTELVVTSTIPFPLPSPSATPNDKIVAEVTRKKASEKPPQSKPPISTSSLFEPVVITIPKKETTQSSERPTLEINRGTGDGRPRLVDGQPVQSIDPPPCQVNVSQEKLLLLSNGGNLPVLVGVEKGYSLSDLKFVVSDPDDILVKYEPDVTDIEGRSLYVISSKSERTGNFRITFYLACGKKDIAVTVR